MPVIPNGVRKLVFESLCVLSVFVGEIHRGEQEIAEASQRFNREDAMTQGDAKKFFTLISLSFLRP